MGENYGKAGQVTNGNKIRCRKDAICMQGNNTDMQSFYLIIGALLQQEWLRDRVTLYVQCLSCINIKGSCHLLRTFHLCVFIFVSAVFKTECK